MSEQKSTGEQRWPVAAMVALACLVMSMVILVWSWHQQYQLFRDLQAATGQAREDYLAERQQFVDESKALLEQNQQITLFATKQRFYSELMGLLSEIMIYTQRQDITALEDSQYRSHKAFYGIEPFLTAEQRQWLMIQLQSINSISGKLTDPGEDFEENLLGTRAQLRQLIDETHQRLYTDLFGNANETETAPAS